PAVRRRTGRPPGRLPLPSSAARWSAAGWLAAGWSAAGWSARSPAPGGRTCSSTCFPQGVIETHGQAVSAELWAAGWAESSTALSRNFAKFRARGPTFDGPRRADENADSRPVGRTAPWGVGCWHLGEEA